MGVDDITPQLEVLEQIHGRAVFQPDFAHGSLSFVRSLVRSTQPQWWRTLIYMTISTMATAAPALLIEWVMTDFGAIQAAPLAIHNLLMLLCFPWSFTSPMSASNATSRRLPTPTCCSAVR